MSQRAGKTDSQIVQELCAQLRAAIPCDERERASIAQFLEIAPTLAKPFDEHADPIHVTGSAIVVGERGVVLHLHKRLNLWLQPGGHIESGETPADGALRGRLRRVVRVRLHGDDEEVEAEAGTGGQRASMRDHAGGGRGGECSGWRRLPRAAPQWWSSRLGNP